MSTKLNVRLLQLSMVMSVIAVPPALFAQHIFRIGPAVGLNMASLSIEGTTDNSIHAGAIVGAVHGGQTRGAVKSAAVAGLRADKAISYSLPRTTGLHRRFYAM